MQKAVPRKVGAKKTQDPFTYLMQIYSAHKQICLSARPLVWTLSCQLMYFLCSTSNSLFHDNEEKLDVAVWGPVNKDEAMNK